MQLGRQLTVVRDPLTAQSTIRGGLGDLDWSGTSDSSGRIRLCGLPSRVTLTALVSRDALVYPDALGAVFLDPGESREIAWTLPRGVRIEGVVVDEDGAPIAGIPVGLFPSKPGSNALVFVEEGEALTARTASSSAGEFAFENVPPGEWICGPVPGASRLTGMPGVRTSAPRAPGDSPVTLRAFHRHFARGGIVLSGGEGRSTIQLRATRADVDGQLQLNLSIGSEFELGPLMPGTYRLEAWRAFAPVSEPVVCSSDDSGLVISVAGEP